MRMSKRRFTRLTRAFGKKPENLKAAVAIHFPHYNFVCTHGILKMTPAMAAGVTSGLWTMSDLLDATISNEESARARFVLAGPAPRVPLWIPSLAPPG
jgi:hypothetical protein